MIVTFCGWKTIQKCLNDYIYSSPNVMAILTTILYNILGTELSMKIYTIGRYYWLYFVNWYFQNTE